MDALYKAECALVASLYHTPNGRDAILDIDAQMVYNRLPRIILERLQKHMRQGDAPDYVVVANELFTENICTYADVSAVMDYQTHPEQWERIVKSAYMEREMARIYAEGQAIRDGSDMLNYQLSRLSELNSKMTVSTASTGTHDAFMAHIENPTALVHTGLSVLDDLIGGFEAGNMVVLAGRPGAGKSAFAFTLSRRLAQAGHGVDVHSFEMDEIEMRRRIIADMTSVDVERIRKRRFDEYELASIREASERIEGLPLAFYNSAGRSVSYITRAIETTKADVVVIDYLQRIASDENGRYEKVTQISNDISNATKKAPRKITIALSQLNRSIDGANRLPQLSDLRESGAIEQDADFVIVVHDPEAEKNRVERKYVKPIELHILKARDGRVGWVTLMFDMRFSRFTERAIEMPSMPF